jgi:hypothetical protein
VHLRRALLLFAIVLGLAALAASVSRPTDESDDSPPPSVSDRRQPTIAPGPETEPATTVELDASADQRRRLEAGRPATLVVNVDEPGLVEVPFLGLSASGDRLTPARFELLVREPDRYALLFTPADGDETEPAGMLVVTEPER